MISAVEKNTSRTESAEAARFLRLLSAQTLGSRDSAFEPVSKLVESFVRLSQEVNQLSRLAADTDMTAEQLRDEVQQRLEEMRQLCNQGITHFQFADALSQRLEHVADGMILLASTLQQPSDDPNRWVQLDADIRDSYTCAEEDQIHLEQLQSTKHNS